MRTAVLGLLVLVGLLILVVGVCSQRNSAFAQSDPGYPKYQEKANERLTAFSVQDGEGNQQVTLIDPEPNPGGVCLYRGCIPSKALLHTAEVINEVAELEQQERNLRLELEHERSPERLAARARELGMVPAAPAGLPAQPPVEVAR